MIRHRALVLGGPGDIGGARMPPPPPHVLVLTSFASDTHISIKDMRHVRIFSRKGPTSSKMGFHRHITRRRADGRVRTISCSQFLRYEKGQDASSHGHDM
jgi:hypothetical protein